DIPDIMASLDIFVFPSHAEAFGKAAIEAMAMGKPVVSTNCDGVLDIVLHGRTGIQVLPRRPDKLAEAIWSLIKDQPKRRKLGKAGCQRAGKYFSARSQIRYLLRSYGELLKKKRKD
ncbi:MAG: glycosyltransferase family 4 protein, partial [Bacteroidota bacterium]